ncbi:MAG: hypothetical protein K2P94_06245 [Rhodospirillaceae bacterium]|nr:hypothetical protein [Rhodospirillaceae bacterium]
MGLQAAAVRCRACQLQICKSRVQGPHAGLTEVKTDESHPGRETFFSCQACGITLINSTDLAKQGWRQAPTTPAVTQLHKQRAAAHA